jgi:DNA-binding response OmpR family regulator
MLPDASGLDVLREIRATDGSNGRFDPGLPVVVLSGRGAPADRVRGLAEGADDYVVKPASYAEYRFRVQSVDAYDIPRCYRLSSVARAFREPQATPAFVRQRELWVCRWGIPSAQRRSLSANPNANACRRHRRCTR